MLGLQREDTESDHSKFVGNIPETICAMPLMPPSNNVIANFIAFFTAYKIYGIFTPRTLHVKFAIQFNIS